MIYYVLFYCPLFVSSFCVTVEGSLREYLNFHFPHNFLCFIFPKDVFVLVFVCLKCKPFNNNSLPSHTFYRLMIHTYCCGQILLLNFYCISMYYHLKHLTLSKIVNRIKKFIIPSGIKHI